MASPYAPFIDEAVERILASDPLELARGSMRGDFVHWDAENEWPYAVAASYLMAVAYAYSQPSSRFHRADDARQMIEDTVAMLVDVAADDRWWHRAPRTGDPNIDRFTLLPLLEAYLVAGEALTAETRQRLLEKVAGVLEVQRREYGEPKNDAQPYPNMDAYYCLIMLHGSRLTGCDACAAEFERFVEIMAAAQFADGGWTYHHGTNECPVYHDINTVLMARVAHLTDDPRARQMLTRSIPYYALVVAPTGQPEYYTDPWWKHSWGAQRSAGPDVVASLTGDPGNRAIGDRLRAQLVGGAIDWGSQVSPLYLVYADMLWQEVEVAEAITAWGIVEDRNIEGPRGRFPAWSWGATARYGSDTLVGALSHSPEYDPVTALMAVTAEIMDAEEPEARLRSHALAITPPDTTGTTHIERDRATFTCAYQMACYRAVWDHEPFPHRWECRQSWEMTEEALTGRIEMVSLAEQASPPPCVRIRLGRDMEAVDLGEGAYRCGPFHIRLSSSDLPMRAVAPAPSVCYLKTLDAVEIILSTDPRPSYSAGQSFAANVVVRHGE